MSTYQIFLFKEQLATNRGTATPTFIFTSSRFTRIKSKVCDKSLTIMNDCVTKAWRSWMIVWQKLDDHEWLCDKSLTIMNDCEHALDFPESCCYLSRNVFQEISTDFCFYFRIKLNSIKSDMPWLFLSDHGYSYSDCYHHMRYGIKYCQCRESAGIYGSWKWGKLVYYYYSFTTVRLYCNRKLKPRRLM
jgi:hypothetical protein